MKKILDIIISVIFKDKFFDIKSRADLFEYWVILLFYLIIPFSITHLSANNTINTIISYYFLFLAPWIISSAIVRRLHDLNLSGFWLLLILAIIPTLFIRHLHDLNLSGFWLLLILAIIPTLFIPGNKENNKYNT